MANYQIAIDGPAGAGKSTIAKLAAKDLGFVYVDTGAMYRALALFFIREKICAGDIERLKQMLKNVEVTIRYEKSEQVVMLNGENVNGLIRSEEVGKMASATSPIAEVRKKLFSLQRKLAEETSVIMDGRDIGTAVLPKANLKIYLTADADVRAKRRYKELLARGMDCDFEKIKNEIIERDRQDMEREVSPLRQAEDAILLDTSELSIEQAKNEVVRLFKAAVEIVRREQ